MKAGSSIAIFVVGWTTVLGLLGICTYATAQNMTAYAVTGLLAAVVAVATMIVVSVNESCQS